MVSLEIGRRSKSAARNDFFIGPTYIRTSGSGGGQTDGFPRRSRSSAGEAYRLGSVAVALAPLVRRLNWQKARRMASSGEPSTYLFILKHVSMFQNERETM